MKVLNAPAAGLEPALKSSQPLARYKEYIYIVPFLAALLGLKLGLALFIWRNGFLEYDADGFTRSVIAWELHNHEKTLQVDAWLPLQFWLNSWLMNFWPDLLHLPRAVNTVASLVTTVNFFFIGRTLFGRLNGYLTAILAALFPWEILFGLSGMSESLTHVFLSTGVLFFCRWLAKEDARPLWLVPASLGFLGATMLRYEAWFYSAVYALIVLYVAWKRRSRLNIHARVQTVLALAPAFVFILAWMYLSWIDPRLHSPLGFATLTSEINQRIYGDKNDNASFLYKLFFYPKTFLKLLPPLSLAAIASSLWLIFRPAGVIRQYLFLVWGEFAIFILTTLPYNNIAPGSARYPVSNLLLLLPLVAYVFQYAIQRPEPLLRYAGGGLFAVLVMLQVNATLDHPRNFPDGDTRQVAQWLEDRWNDGSLQSDDKVVLHLPFADGPEANDFTRAYYALKVLTNHPDNFEILSDYGDFSAAVQDQSGKSPRVWVHMKSAGGSIEPFKFNYRVVKDMGDYVVAEEPYYKPAVVTPARGTAGQNFEFKSSDWRTKETTSSWITRPDGKAINLGNKDADEKGNLVFNYTITDTMPGRWSVTIVGMQTGRRSVASFDVVGG
ncbi:MAG TPA: hypothetical protein VH186_24455 [Chloroflexia bacterium]|nr:hypothetical protein [Chloroflexia bacterium]